MINHYTDENNLTWSLLLKNQSQYVQKYAAAEYLQALKKLKLPKDRVPSIEEVSNQLENVVGWRLKEVKKIIEPSQYFLLLSKKILPVITKIRPIDQLDFYISESPDIFHEIFGHCPLILNPKYACFLNEFGIYGVNLNKKYHNLFARLFWYTIEFGLVYQNKKLKAYGAGIIPSKDEMLYATKSNLPKIVEFTIDKVVNQNYSVTEKQKIYFFINDFYTLYNSINQFDTYISSSYGNIL